jgi:hypothetical protein
MDMITEDNTRAIFEWLVKKQQMAMFSIEYFPETPTYSKCFKTIKARSEKEALEKSGLDKSQIIRIKLI